jgi:two-component system, NtrC family, response regulator AtoC
MARILFINNDSNAHRVLRMILPREFHLISSYRGAQGIEAASHEYPDLVLLDIDLPDKNGIDVLKNLTHLPSAPPVVILTALAKIQLVVEAMRSGACDYLVKPFELRTLTDTMRSYIRQRSLVSDSMTEHPCLAGFVGESPAMIAVKKRLVQYASSDSPVLIYGESGTGKELAARITHDLSERASRPFIARNCAAIPGTLVETELFGSERGAFTDAVSRPGSFELANGGTLFLDEIGEIQKETQAKLLRVLENSLVTRLGASRPLKIDLRIVSATNKNLMDASGDGSFREDLLYRINTLPITLPPLRERPEDLPLLAAHILRSAGVDLSESAVAKLKGYNWPGNVRELKNVLERGALFANGGKIDASDVIFDRDL